MLVLKRREGNWTRVRHVKSGEILCFRVCKIRGSSGDGQVDVVFEDPDRNFQIERPERKIK